MTFETWWVQCVVWAGLDTNLTRTKAKFVWDAAVKAERERIDKLLNEAGWTASGQFTDGLELARELISGVQDQTTATCGQGTEGTSGETTEGPSSG